ncbi:hypothetical protein BDV26DRAFT_106561 [Aspergillus bertholletiae]|uniref:Uncharacterized protein n=1 Tax=Aspergillus bertholletiae TaxID=1226010 RepID=A0A5N7BHB9_9EURO|nr:hypothetical protein BDV26DRAFT_106561 [Aspergillus bertholletiae]
MCSDVGRLIVEFIVLVYLKLSFLVFFLALPREVWRAIHEHMAAITRLVERRIEHFMMPRLLVNGDIYNPNITARRAGAPWRLRESETRDQSTSDDGSIATGSDMPGTARRQPRQSEQGSQNQGPQRRQPRQQHPEPQEQELQQLGPRQQSPELPPREPMPRERVTPQQGSGEPAPMPGVEQPRGNTLSIHFEPNGAQPRQYTPHGPPSSDLADQPNQPTQGGEPTTPGSFPVS